MFNNILFLKFFFNPIFIYEKYNNLTLLELKFIIYQSQHGLFILMTISLERKQVLNLIYFIFLVELSMEINFISAQHQTTFQHREYQAF
jgi:hypothetical protein